MEWWLDWMVVKMCKLFQQTSYYLSLDLNYLYLGLKDLKSIYIYFIIKPKLKHCHENPYLIYLLMPINTF